MFKRIADFLKSSKDLSDIQEKAVSYNDTVEETNKIIKDNKEAIETKAIQLANNKIPKFLNDYWTNISKGLYLQTNRI